MKSPYSVIKRPVMTEKATMLTERHNQYAFSVDRRANKQEIQNAIEELFDVTVLSLRVINVRGKKRRMGLKYRKLGMTASWKKAIITLPPDQTIDLLGEGS